MNKSKVLFLFACLLIFSCNSYNHPDVFEVPYDYEGHVCIVFGVNPPKGDVLEDKGKYNLLEIKSPPYAFVSKPAPKNPNTYLFMFSDSRVHTDIGLNDTLDPSYDRVFFVEMDSVIVGSRSYTYMSGLVTRDFHQPEDSVVLNQKVDRGVLQNELIRRLADQ